MTETERAAWAAFEEAHPDIEQAMRLCTEYEQLMTPQARTYTEVWRDGKLVRRTWDDTSAPVEVQPTLTATFDSLPITVTRDGETWQLWQCSCGRWYRPGQFCCH